MTRKGSFMTRTLCTIAVGAVAGVVLLAVAAFVASRGFDAGLVSF